MPDCDRTYYEQRAATEREMAAAAADPRIAAIHMELAERYDLLAASNARAPTGPPQLQVVKQ